MHREGRRKQADARASEVASASLSPLVSLDARALEMLFAALRAIVWVGCDVFFFHGGDELQLLRDYLLSSARVHNILHRRSPCLLRRRDRHPLFEPLQRELRCRDIRQKKRYKKNSKTGNAMTALDRALCPSPSALSQASSDVPVGCCVNVPPVSRALLLFPSPSRMPVHLPPCFRVDFSRTSAIDVGVLLLPRNIAGSPPTLS